MKLRFLISFLGLFWVLPSSIFAGDGSCLYSSIDLGFEHYQKLYQGSVFKVYSSTVKSDNFLGTATLIDSRGYFLTASHLFREAPYIDENYDKKIEPFQGKLILKNNVIGIEFEGQEVFSPRSKHDPDLSIIVGDLRNVEVPPVELLIEKHDEPGQFLLIGYSKDVPNLEKEIVSSTSGFTPKLKMLRVNALQVFKGKSGSLGINRRGQGIAALHGHDGEGRGRLVVLKNEGYPPNRGSVFLTPTFLGTNLFLQIPNTPRGELLIQKIRERQLLDDQDFVANLNYNRLSNIEFLHLFKSFEDDYQIFNSAYDLYSEIIESLFACKGLTQHVINFYKLQKRLQQAGFQTLKNGRELARIETMLSTNGWPETYSAPIAKASFEYLREYAVGDPNGLVFALKSKKIPEKDKFQSNVWLDLAKSARKTKKYFPDSNIKEEEIQSWIEVALETNPKNFKAHRFLIAEYDQKNQPGLAAWAAASAIKLGDPNSERLINDLQYTAAKAMQHPQDNTLVQEKVLYNLSKIRKYSGKTKASQKFLADIPTLTSKDIAGKY